MDQQDCIILKIPNAREKLLPMFPNDTQRGDLKVVFKSKVFNLCKAHLRLESGYFKKLCMKNQTIDEIKQNFDPQAFSNILSCFYGASVAMQRAKLEQYYQVIRFLEIETLLSFLRKDVLANVSQYDLFVAMRIAHKYSDQQMFVVCLEQLEKQSFEQLKLHQFELLHTELPLFKLIIKAHDRHRNEGKPGIPYKDIDQIIRDYCDGKVMGEEGYQGLKLELINQNSLTASQYKEIFLDQYIKIKNNPSASTIIGDYPPSKSIIVNGNTNLGGGRLETNKLAQSVIAGSNFSKNTNVMVSQNQINPTLGYSAVNNQYMNTQYGFQYNQQMNQRTLQMQYTFQKKQNQQLKVQKKKLQEQLALLKRLTKQNQDSQKQNQQQLRILKQELKKKINQEIEHKKIIEEMRRNVDKMNEKLRQRSEAINQLAKQLEQLKKKRPVQEDEQQNNMIVQSQFLPAHLITEMMSQNVSKNTSKPGETKKQPEKKVHQTPNYEAMDQDELEQLYLPRITFDIEPVSTPKYNLPKLCIFITSQGFTKNTLTLIYRRSLTNPSKGNDSDLRDKKNLLILINTTTGQNIGGFVSVPIGKNETNYIQDKGAFLFTLTKNRKFNVSPLQAEEAIFLSDQYLLCFANDLMISNDCLKQPSQCSWPSSYEGAKETKAGGHVWFAGEKQFRIKDLQVYQLGQQQMEMVLV